MESFFIEMGSRIVSHKIYVFLSTSIMGLSFMLFVYVSDFVCVMGIGLTGRMLFLDN